MIDPSYILSVMYLDALCQHFSRLSIDEISGKGQVLFMIFVRKTDVCIKLASPPGI